MDDTDQLLATLSHAYGAQSVASRIPSTITKNLSLARVNNADGGSFEELLKATKNVGQELVTVLSTKLAMERVFDQLSSGLIVTTAELRVLSMNKAARGLLDARCGLTLMKRRLVCMDERSHQKLEEQLRRLHGNSNSQAAGAAVRAAVRVARANDKPDFQLQIIRFGSLFASPEAPDIPAYCIWIFDPAAQRNIDAVFLRDLHGLTVTESAVTAALFRGCTIEAAAVELGVSINTIKTHLKHIFQKCEVRSQAELLQMLALGPRGV